MRPEAHTSTCAEHMTTTGVGGVKGVKGVAVVPRATSRRARKPPEATCATQQPPTVSAACRRTRQNLFLQPQAARQCCLQQQVAASHSRRFAWSDSAVVNTSSTSQVDPHTLQVVASTACWLMQTPPQLRLCSLTMLLAPPGSR